MATLSIAVHFGDHSYDGPFDALFNLIRYRDYPIEALPIARLTADFLAYVRSAKELDEDLGCEFMEVASWLVLLKSRAMLPVEAFGGELESPQEELRKVLIDRGLIKDVTQDLNERSMIPPQPSLRIPIGRTPDVPCETEPNNNQLTAGDALKAAEIAMALARTRRYAQKEEGLTVEDASSWIRKKLAAMPTGTAVSSASWFEEMGNPANCAALVLALLELARRGYVLLHQQDTGGRILVKQVRDDVVVD